MIKNGVRINDLYLNNELFKLFEILTEVDKGYNYFWSLLELYAVGSLGEGKSTPEFTKMIDESENGYSISWNELIELSTKFDQIIDMVLVGSKNKNNLHRFSDDRELYEVCEIVIVMHDSFYWEIFSDDLDLIDRLVLKFKDVERIRTDNL